MAIPIKDKTLRFPLKIGETQRVPTYAASLTDGEEQLLVTRDGKLFITDGKGGYFVFKSNDVYSTKEIDDIVTLSEGRTLQTINTLADLVDQYHLELVGRADSNLALINENIKQINLNKETIILNKKEIEDALNLFKLDTNNSILLIEKAIEQLSKDSGISLSSIEKLIGDITTADPSLTGESIIELINDLYAKTVLGKGLIADAINTVMPTLEANKDHSYEQLASLISEIKTGGLGGPTIHDISNHTSLPSFSKHAKLNTFTAEE